MDNIFFKSICDAIMTKDLNKMVHLSVFFVSCMHFCLDHQIFI